MNLGAHLRPSGPPSRKALRRRAHLRRGLSATLAAVAVTVGLHVAGAAHRDAVTAVVVVGDQPAGHRLADGDLTERPVDPTVVPASAVRSRSEAVGQVLGHPVGAGEVLAAPRLRPSSGLVGLPDSARAVHVPIGDPGAVDLVRPGDRVDVLALASGEVVGTGLLVLSVDAATSGTGLASGGSSPAAGLVVAVPPQATARLVGALGPTSPSGGVHLAVRAGDAR